jgi:hypothetical protein
MKLRRSTRAWTATVVALCMLFAQLAVAAYICPELLEDSTAVTASNSVAMADCASMLAGPMDPVQPNLCKAHCAPGLQLSDAHNDAEIYAPALYVLCAAVWVVLPSLQRAPPIGVVGDAAERPPGIPPLYLIHQVFRL